MQDLEAKAEVVREQARTHGQVVAAYDRVNASLQLANSEGHMYKTRIIQLEAEAKRDAAERRSFSLSQACTEEHMIEPHARSNGAPVHWTAASSVLVHAGSCSTASRTCRGR